MCVHGRTKAVHIYYLPLCKWKKKLSIQTHSYDVSLCDSNCHLVNVTELYMCLSLASCFHPVRLDLIATEDLTGLTNHPKERVCVY